MRIRFRNILYSWQAAVITLICLPLLAYGLVRWTEDRYAPLPFYGTNNAVVSGPNDAARLPAFAFTNQYGATVTNTRLQHHITIAHYFFTSCPTVCPAMMRQLQQVYAAFRNDTGICFVSLTVDPLRDSSTALLRYGRRLSLPAQGWELLTGDKPSLYRFARKGLYITATDGDGGPDDFIHSENIVLLDRQQHIRGYYQGTSATAAGQLIADIKKLQHER
ncbi:SCO family protein [Chitinophaga oryzae]|uniref:SCO family protein n=1 Tax=Chitinophaga oryzae TaxID=2725414 RepID=A0AAE6ZEE7_9BACT|nr:SCO family protein [Chitinophaga oryzae]QJB30092.1 SCO family protein [Chitinophaga oryzae]QJB36589.1 SCO family protein [Chitinophaga oryzae]